MKKDMSHNAVPGKRRVEILRIDNPENGNRLTVAMMDEMTSTLHRLAQDEGVGAVVLSSVGDVFCLGGDLKSSIARGEEGVRDFGRAFIALHTTIVSTPKPIIAAVDGLAFGGGLSLVEACDLAVAGERAVFAVPEIKYDLAPMMSLAAIGRVFGRTVGLELAYTGRKMMSAEARACGLVNMVVQDGKAEEQAMALAAKIASSSRVAVSMCKSLYTDMFEGDYEALLMKGLEMLVALLMSDERKKSR